MTTPTAMAIRVRKFPLCLPPEDLLATRDDGEKELDCLQKELQEAPPGEVVGIDLSEVRFMNYSFADECFGKLCARLQAGEHPDRYVVLLASQDDIKDKLQDIAIALKGRKLAMLCFFDAEGLSERYIVGELPESLDETLRAVEPGDTNEDLADKLNIKLTTCSNRTDKLARMRLLRKQPHLGEHRYKQYEFSPVVAPAP